MAITIHPSFWYDNNAAVAMDNYASVLPHASSEHPNGFISECHFQDGIISGINGGPAFRPNQTVSLYTVVEDLLTITNAYDNLREGGKVMMALGKYDWAEHYAWVEDKYGVSWQLSVAEDKPMISTAIMFTGLQAGRAEQAMQKYLSIFPESAERFIYRYPNGKDEGLIAHAQLSIGSARLIMMDSSFDHKVEFSEGASIVVVCDNQDEIDHIWHGLISDGGQEGRCGWCRDAFGFSWQVIPRQMLKWMSDPSTIGKVVEAFKPMGKLDIGVLESAAK